MIITCPSCSARYLVGSNDIGHGRQVKCKRCDFSWFQDNDSFVEVLLIKKDVQPLMMLTCLYYTKLKEEVCHFHF